MMKQRRRGLPCLSLAFVLLFAACGGRQSVASRSAAAYGEAMRKGTPVEGGHDHGGHAAGDAEANADGSQMSGMDHSTMQSATMPPMDHSQMQAGTTSAMDHSHMQAGSMPAMDHSQMQAGTKSAMDHSHMQTGSMPQMDHSRMQTGSMPQMDHSRMQTGSMPAMDHSHMQTGTTPAMDHSTMQTGTMPGMQHGTPTAAAPPARSTADLARVDPAATLGTDSFDTPSPISVAEAVKAANNVPDGDIRHIVPGQDRQNPPTPQPAFRGQTPAATSPPAAGHSAHQTSAPAEETRPAGAVVYACPMHPEVTSDRPGQCPKCGMTLVKKEN